MINPEESKYWSLSASKVLESFNATPAGLAGGEADSRLNQYGENAIRSRKKTAPLMQFLNQFKNPIIIILVIATLISAFTGDWLDSLIIFAILLASAILSFLQEYSAGNAIEELRSKVHIMSTVLRDGKSTELPSSQLVPGDVVMLSTGSLVPADGLVLECDDFFVNQSILTGETFPVEKKTGPVPEDSNLTERENCVFMGTNVHSGSAKVLISRTGAKTEFGQIAKHLNVRQPETEFERGVRRFGYLLTEIMLVLTLAVFAINVILRKPAIDSLLFSVALAVGITPQLLPTIISITLAKGSRMMAKAGVIVRHLTTIENFGSMDILCTDKTGTLTEGLIELDGSFDAEGKASEPVFRLAYLNSSLQVGMVNAMDQAIMAYKTLETEKAEKLGEVAYDFTRKRLSVIVCEGNEVVLITKGALDNILDICTQIRSGYSINEINDDMLKRIRQRFIEWSNQGYRVLGIAQKTVPTKDKYDITDEKAMVFEGFLLFFDPPKADAGKTIVELSNLGVELRIITGDNKFVAIHTANTIGLKVHDVLTGGEIIKLNDKELRDKIETTTLFAEVDPSQKERIILALKKRDHVVGYMGDGINDAPALHAADVSISVNTAVDVAKDAADFVLIEKSLGVLKRGIELGRAAFANTLKYIYITTSANFGNMFSMAGASLFMPFLPLLPKQILLINFITDFPALAISGDSVDAEMVQKPRRWDIKFIRDFMITFGLISSVFDYITFAVLLIGFKAPQELFQSGWFVLSILTELLVLLVMRTQKPFFKSKPSPILLWMSLGTGILTLIIPYLHVQKLLDITSIPPSILLSLLGVAGLYILTTEIAKHYFYKIKGSPKRK